MHGHDADMPLDMQARDTSVQKLWSRSLRKLLYALEIVRHADLAVVPFQYGYRIIYACCRQKHWRRPLLLVTLIKHYCQQ